jgi:predicted nucleic acid-binding protein
VPADDLQNLLLLVDPGEAEAILLASQKDARFILIDDQQGRALARSRGLRIVGIGGCSLRPRNASSSGTLARSSTNSLPEATAFRSR